jgi:hypothetical protein
MRLPYKAIILGLPSDIPHTNTVGRAAPAVSSFRIEI